VLRTAGPGVQKDSSPQGRLGHPRPQREEAFTTAWAEGRAMTPEQAIIYAVSDSVSR
jgi:hypothetical protein